MRNGLLLIVTAFLAVGLKIHYSRAGSEELGWILRPTAALVEQISGIPFEKEAYTGFVNYARGIVIAPACAGVNFLIIVFCMAAVAGVRQLPNGGRKWLWLLGSLAASYALTVLANTGRILVSIHTFDAGYRFGGLTAEQIHRLEGVVIYFFFLCLFYRIIITVCFLLGATKKQNGVKRPVIVAVPWASAALVPLFWYGLITLALPALNGAVVRDEARFTEHAAMIILGCLAVWAFIFVIQSAWRRLKPVLLR
ncbi:MAG TPA: exosortase K [Candidatus Binatia bacterium]|nr:exosortase K [Candidatus Binatia bacterium]